MNIAIFSGNLVKDVTTAQATTGTPMAFFTLAVNSGFGDKTHVDYVDCVIFGKRAEGGLIQYLTKGKQVMITGTVILESREYEGKEYKNMKVNISELDLVGSKPDGGAQTGQQSQAQTPADNFSDQIPF